MVFDLDRFDFSRSRSVFPYALTSLSGELIFAYWDGDDFYPVLRFEPGLYYTRSHITKNSFDVPIRFTPGLKLSDNLYVIGGISLDIFLNLTIFSFFWVKYKRNEQRNFSGGFPRPRL